VNLEPCEKIAEAVLYEGYMLYPYRPSSVKNQQRWNFGVLYPQAYCELQSGADTSMMQTECLVKTTPETRLTVKVRFLQIIRRTVGKARQASAVAEHGQPEFEPVDRLEVEGRIYQPWQEAIEREVVSGEMDPAELASAAPVEFEFPEGREFEYLRDAQSEIAGVLVRDRETLAGTIEFDSEKCRDGVIKTTVRVRNCAPFDSHARADREAALMFSLVSAHTILGVEQGEFASLLEPPVGLEDLATSCKNVGTWPVLVGERGEMVLSSPIILYDHPQIAPESAGNLFDSTEIDEILSLRILTLTDDEKCEMRQSDDHARKILERTESMPEEQFMKLHGVLRGLTPLKEETL
jgi:hydrogenase maturation protease